MLCAAFADSAAGGFPCGPEVRVADGYDLFWNARFPGGVSSGGGYTMNSAIGQPFAGVVADPGYSLCAGFLCGAEPKTLLYLPLVRK